MRKLGWLAIASVLCLLAPGCPGERGQEDAGPIDAGPRELSEREPNDRPEQAQPVSETQLVSARLSADPARPDEDWFQLLSPSPHTVDVQVTGIPAADLAIYVMDADRNQLALVNGAGEGKGERLPNLGVLGKALVKIAGVKKGAGGSYAVTFRFAPAQAGFESEPNDRAVDATPATLGQPVSGYLGHPEDQDWFRFELPVEQPAPLDQSMDGGEADAAGAEGADGGVEAPRLALKVELTPVAGVRYELSVLSAAEAPLFQVKGKEGEGLSLRNIGARSTDRTVFLVVKSAFSGSGKEARRGHHPELSYALTVSQEEAGATAEYEPNDEPLKATPLIHGGFREGYLSPKGDLDYYVLRVAQPSLANVELTGVERVDLVLSLIQPSGEGAEQVLMKVNDGAVKEPEYFQHVSCAAECWFKVEGGSRKVEGKFVRDFENAERPYRLSVAVAPDDGGQEREPNGAQELATKLELGRPVRGTVHPRKDVDYYRLDLSGRPLKAPLRISATGILKVDIGLYLHRLEAEGKLSLVQTADRAKGEAVEQIHHTAEPGVYLIEVRDAKNREANFQDAYQLTVEEAD